MGNIFAVNREENNEDILVNDRNKQTTSRKYGKGRIPPNSSMHVRYLSFDGTDFQICTEKDRSIYSSRDGD